MSTQEIYDVAISFAGEDRSLAEELSAMLKERGVRVFYDADEMVSLWGRDLYELLNDIYRNKARHCLMLISESYADKMWPTHERRSAQARRLSKEDYILPVRLDDVDIPGLETVSYFDARGCAVEEIVDAVVAKLQGSTIEVSSPTAAPARTSLIPEEIPVKLGAKEVRVHLQTGKVLEVQSIGDGMQEFWVRGVGGEQALRVSGDILSVRRGHEVSCIYAEVEDSGSYVFAARNHTTGTLTFDRGETLAVAACAVFGKKTGLKTLAQGGKPALLRAFWMSLVVLFLATGIFDSSWALSLVFWSALIGVAVAPMLSMFMVKSSARILAKQVSAAFGTKPPPNL